MKRRIICALLVVCMALALLPFGAVTAHAADNTFRFGNRADAYTFTKSGSDILITCESDWNALSAAVKEGYTCKGLRFRMTNDISVSQMIGEQVSAYTQRRFAGTFNGDGHTLTVNYDATVKEGQFRYNQNYAAPFAFADRVCIKNLTVDGTIKTDHKYAAGVVASLTNGGRLENVCVNATIESVIVKGEGKHGGLVAVNENGPCGPYDRSPMLVLKGCTFEGSLLGEGTYNCGGMVGSNKAKVWLECCLFNPLELTFNGKPNNCGISETFVRMEGSNPSYNLIDAGYNYYTRTLGYVHFWAIWVGGVVIDADEGCEVTVKCGNTVIKDRALVCPGTKLTVEAKAKEGYELIETPESSYVVYGLVVIRARSKAQEVEQGYVVTLVHENGAEPAWSGIKSLTNAHYSDHLIITAGEPDEGYEFIGWYQPNGRLLTKEETYNAYVYCDVTYEARYQVKAHKVVTFMSNDIVVKTLDDVDSVSAEDFPVDPAPNNGYRFVRWDKAAEEVNAALADESLAQGGTVTVNAVFEKANPDALSVSVSNGEQEERTEAQANANQWFNVTAMEVPGKYFAYWTCQQAGEMEVRSCRANASFLLTKDATLTAVYSDSPVEQTATAGLCSVTYNLDSSKLVTVAYLTVPENAVIRAAGVVAASNNEGSKYHPEQELTMDNADYVKVSKNYVGTNEPVNYTWTKTNVNKPGEIWYLRAYVIYADENGTEHTIYGEPYTAVIDDMANKSA